MQSAVNVLQTFGRPIERDRVDGGNALSGSTVNYVMATFESAVDVDNIRSRQCFACGGKPSSGVGEHVFPKWLQTRFDLFDERLTLQNGTLIPYRALTVSCCAKCNNGFLSGIESKVQTIIERGTVDGDPDVLSLGRWMSKIFVGILVKETALLLDRKDPSLGHIMAADFIGEFANCQLILQSARKPTLFCSLHGKFPFSLFWYRIDTERGFDISTDIVGQSIAMRLGALGIIFVNDGGLQLNAGVDGPFGLQGLTVTPLQFNELAARVHTKASLRDATHSYANSETPEHLTIEQQDVHPYTSTILAGGEMQVFEPWNSEMFAVRASRITRLDESVFLDPVTRHEMTLLTNLITSKPSDFEQCA
ncbi:hypothetical protein [Devosia sp. MC521]|nr:hypothetical protein [Devosia sp. MC521]QMW64398.1 hypothetical protein H4N61_08915 [Devosia sp. MC521]